MMCTEEIENLLNRMGLPANRIGFFYITDAVALAMEDRQRLLLVTKWLYPQVAKKYGTSWKSVERDIRYEIERLKIGDQEPVCRLLHITPGTKLTSAKLIALLTAYVMTEPDA